MGQVDVSVIMPAYNAEKTIGRAIRSVIMQTMKSFELIIINDGSIDDTLKIVEEFEDSRIKLINQKNGGPLAAIRKGVNNAKGKYIAFIDADDEFHEDFLKITYNEAELKNADIAVCGFYSCINNQVIENSLTDNTFCYTKSDIDQYLIYDFLASRKLQGVRWNKLYKKSLIDISLQNISKDFNYGEDVAMVLVTFLEATKIVVLNESLYYYYDTTASLQKRMRQIDSCMVASKEMYNAIEGILLKYNKESAVKDLAYNFLTEFLMYLSIVDQSNITYIEKKKYILRELYDIKTSKILNQVEKKNWKRSIILFFVRNLKNVFCILLAVRSMKYLGILKYK